MTARRITPTGWILSSCFAIANAATLLAAPNPPPPPAPAFSSKAVLQSKTSALESDLADMLQQRGVPSDLRGPLLEMEIDLRVLSRWAFSKAAEATPDSEVQVALFLRGVSLLEAGDVLGTKLQQATGPLSGAQLEGLKQFHELTYKLPKGASVAEIDEACREAGTLLIGVAGPVSGAIKAVPPMRPIPIDNGPAPTQTDQRPGLVDLAKRAENAKVGPALHRELVALAANAADPQPKEAGPEMLETLSRSVQLAESLSTNLAVDTTSRAKLESEMAGGLALYTDSRTRDAAHARLENLARYGSVVARINRLKIAPSVKETLAPVFTWARLNPDKGAKLFEAIESYVQFCDRFDARKGSSTTLSGGARKIVENLVKEFTTDRSAFLDDAGGFGKSESGSGAPEVLIQHVERMKRSLAAIEANERLPRALQILNKFRVKPVGGLEKRAVIETNNSASALSSALRDEGAQFLDAVESLATQAGALTGEPLAVPPALAKSYGGGKLAAFEAKRAEMVSDLASQLASGKEMDRDRFQQLQATAALEQAVASASVIEDVLARAELLHRWVDWTIDADRLRRLLATYREDTSAAIIGVAEGDNTVLITWNATRHRFAPLLALLARDAEYLDACAALPGSAITEPAKLATPLDGQPFGSERHASLALWLCFKCLDDGNRGAADQILNTLSDRLRNELHVSD